MAGGLYSWYTGLDGRPRCDQYDLVTVLLHEMLHSLGFASYWFQCGTTPAASTSDFRTGWGGGQVSFGMSAFDSFVCTQFASRLCPAPHLP